MKITITTLILGLFIFISCNNSESNEEVSYDLNYTVEDFFESDIKLSSSRIRNFTMDDRHDEKASLGKLLFYERRLSLNNTVSCGSCHRQQLGFSDDERFSTGLFGRQTTRNAMSLANNAYQISHFWQGFDGGLGDHVLNPISNHIEMGMYNNAEMVGKLTSIPEYVELFDQVYGAEISEGNVREAMTYFVSSILSYRAKYDKRIATGLTSPSEVYSAQEEAGFNLFFGKALCGDCHQGRHLSASWRRHANIGLDLVYEDQGAGNGMFKVPSLRNVALSGPYMHDGRYDSLEEVVEHYVDGVKDHPQLDWTLKNVDIDLDDREKYQLIAFLHTLTDHELLRDERFSDPFR